MYYCYSGTSQYNGQFGTQKTVVILTQRLLCMHNNLFRPTKASVIVWFPLLREFVIKEVPLYNITVYMYNNMQYNAFDYNSNIYIVDMKRDV